jgi:hypothetical protein
VLKLALRGWELEALDALVETEECWVKERNHKVEERYTLDDREAKESERVNKKLREK